jgi:hydroxyethylthiazole kinase
MPAEGEEMRTSEDAGAMPHLAAQLAADVLERLRRQAPRVHCITNAVAQNFTANVLLAAGAVPSMTIAPEEIGRFVASANALLVNLGTFDHERRDAIAIAIEAANKDQVPWVLDPVLIDRAPLRAEFARELVARGPKVVRLNRAEFSVLSGADAKPETLTRYARDRKLVAALSGETDFIADGARLAVIANGHPLMARVTAMGCAGSALTAACLAVESDPWNAGVAALLIFAIAGELAGANAAGPGSFAVAIIDALHRLDAASLIARARVS